MTFADAHTENKTWLVSNRYACNCDDTRQECGKCESCIWRKYSMYLQLSY